MPRYPSPKKCPTCSAPLQRVRSRRKSSKTSLVRYECPQHHVWHEEKPRLRVKGLSSEALIDRRVIAQLDEYGDYGDRYSGL